MQSLQVSVYKLDNTKPNTSEHWAILVLDSGRNIFHDSASSYHSALVRLTEFLGWWVDNNVVSNILLTPVQTDGEKKDDTNS